MAALRARARSAIRRRSRRLPPLLTDPAPLVRGRAAEALGLDRREGCGAGDRPDGGGVREEPGGVVDAAGRRDAGRPRPEAEAFRLGLFALVRLERVRADRGGGARHGDQPVSRGGRWRTRCSASTIRGRRPALLQLLERERAVHARVCGARPRPAEGRLRPSSRWSRCSTRQPRAALRGRRVAAIRALAQLGATDGGGRARADRRRAPRRIRTSGSRRWRRSVRCARPTGSPIVQDLMTDEWPAMRAAALRAAAAIDQESFVAVLAGHRSRSALAGPRGARRRPRARCRRRSRRAAAVDAAG